MGGYGGKCLSNDRELRLRTVHRIFAFAVMQQWIQRNSVTASLRPETEGRIPCLFWLHTLPHQMQP